ncbi:MAG: HNH endonuclease [Opitutales bacterium]
MINEIIPYIEMCQREGTSLQKGMNFGLGGDHSVILMSVRPGAPYEDRIEDHGETLIYEGHDVNRTRMGPNPKTVDQPQKNASGSLTENGKFYQAALHSKDGTREPERVRVYEKIKPGIWSYNGVFHLVDAWIEQSGVRNVFKFKLIAVEGDEDFSSPVSRNLPHRRIIPTKVKLAVWERDQGKCVECGSTDNLHFDHILPFSKGGASITAENVQLLCMRHNLQKSDRIQ